VLLFGPQPMTPAETNLFKSPVFNAQKLPKKSFMGTTYSQLYRNFENVILLLLF
jgi:hypothetical protein